MTEKTNDLIVSARRFDRQQQTIRIERELEVSKSQTKRDNKIKTIVNHLRSGGSMSQVQLAVELFSNLSMSVCELGVLLDTIPLIKCDDKGLWSVRDGVTEDED